MNKSDLRSIFIVKLRAMVEQNPEIEKLGYFRQDHFTPHESVLDAMELAYNMGLKNAAFIGAFDET